MRKTALIAGATAAALAVALAGCGSSSSSTKSADSSAPKSGAPINVGVVTSLSGGYASGFLTVENGVKARFAVENAKGGVDGHKLTYTMADDASTAAGALAATNKLIKQDKVFAILDGSPVFYGAAAAAKQAAMPVMGVSFDGGDYWHDKSYSTFFDTTGNVDFSLVPTTYGAFFKSQGCTKVGGIGNTGPSSGRAAEAAVLSAKNAGLQGGYLETKLAPGTTDIGPQVIALKNSGTDCIFVPVTPSLAFALVAGLKQAGVSMKSILLATGYGGDILKNKAGLALANGVDFATAWAPVELQTDATKAFQDALSKYAGETSVPTFGEYVGWGLADLFIHGLQKAGGDASQADLVKAISGSTDWSDGGLFSQPVNFADPVPSAVGVDNCDYIVKLQGNAFKPIAGASPACGKIVEGVKTTAS